MESDFKTPPDKLSAEQTALVAALKDALGSKRKKKEGEEPVARNLDTLLDDDQLPEIYYAGSKGKYWLKHEGRFLELNETGVIRILKLHGFSPVPNKKTGVSEVEMLLAYHQQERHFNWIGTIAGWPVGCFEYDGLKLLNLRENKVWELPAEPKATPKLDSFFERLLGDKQTDYLKAWVKLSRETWLQGRSRIVEGRQPKFRIGQALTIVGSQGDGKTVAGGVLSAMLAGPGSTAGNPGQAARGETTFNEDLAEKMVHVLDDETGDADYKARQKFGEAIKRSVATHEKRVHGKGTKAITLEPFCRTILLLNDELENIQILPPLDGSIGDKFLITKTVGKGFGDLSKDTSRYEERMDELFAEIPDYLAALEQWEIPQGIRDARYGVVSYHNPEVASMVAELGGEQSLAEVLKACTVGYEGEPLSSAQLYAKLTGDADTARKLSAVARQPITFGKLLAKLEKRHPGFRQRAGSEYGILKYTYDFTLLK